MTFHHTLPSEIEPEALGDLIQDCNFLPEEMQPHEWHDTVVPVQRNGKLVLIPDTTTELLDGYGDYGS